MLVIDMYHQYHSRLTRGCLARGSRGDDSSGERSHARAFLSGGLVVLASRCVWREVRGSVPRRPHVSREIFRRFAHFSRFVDMARRTDGLDQM